jgi:pyruvate formate lyase activating enzyme
MQAYIGGIIRRSETDWDGKRCMVIFFSGCGFRCPFCRTPEILGFRQELLRDLRDVKREISAAGEIDAVLFTGGEPCLQKLALLELAKHCRDSGLKVGLETNGARPDCIRALIEEGLVDFIRLDVKAPMRSDIFQKATESATFFKPAESVMDDFSESLELLRDCDSNGRVELELRTTVVPTLVFRKDDLLNIASMLKGFASVWMLQKFMPEPRMASRKFESVNAPSDEFLANLRDAITKEFPMLNVQVREDMRELSLPPEIVIEEKEGENL